MTPAGKDGSYRVLYSVGNLIGIHVPPEQVEAVLDICRQAHWHTFFLLTKNAPRLLKFIYPPNVWVGVSSAPDYMFGKALTRKQQKAYMRKALEVLAWINPHNTTWMSMEPLSWDISQLVAAEPHALDWAVIGAASNGRNEFPPEEAHVRNVLAMLDDQDVPVFFKGNMKSTLYKLDRWRQDFPAKLPVDVNEIIVAKPGQMELGFST